MLLELIYSFEHGGSEQIGASLALAIAGRGYPVTVASVFEGSGPLREKLTAGGVRCESYDLLGSGNDRRTVRKQIADFVGKNNVSTIHGQHASVFALADQAVSVYRPRAIVTEHVDDPFRRSWRMRRAARKAFTLADEITVIHGGLKEYFCSRLKVPEDKIVVIPNGVDIRLFSPDRRHAAREALGLSADRLAFGFVGRLAPEKDIETLCGVISSVISTVPGSISILIGDGTERKRLENGLATLTAGDRCRILGARADVAGLLPAFDVLLLTSRTEGVPVVILEALACGVPCVSTPVGGIREVLDDTCGRLEPVGDVKGLAAAVREILLDRGLRSELSRSARSRAEKRLDFDTIVDRYLALFRMRSA